MRKILIISFLSIHLLGNTEIGQLFRLPLLISHFLQHHRQDHSINFLDFMALHYLGNDGTTADDDIDKKLPFHNTTHNTISIAYVPMVNDIISTELFLPASIEYSNQILVGKGREHVHQMLQPPRVA